MEAALAAVKARTANDGSDPLLLATAQARKLYAKLGTSGRPLRPDEQRDLQANGNWAADWSLVRVTEGVESLQVANVRACCFHGAVELGSFESTVTLPGLGSTPLPSGVYNSMLAWCVIGDSALIKGCELVSRCVVGPRAALVNCGLIACSQEGASGARDGAVQFANGTSVTVGPETGGREVPCYATMGMGEAVALAMDRSRPRAVEGYTQAVREFATLAACPVTVFGEEACALSCPRVVDVFLGPGGLLEGSSVERSTILSTLGERSCVRGGSLVQDSLVQPGCSLKGACIVSHSLLMEHSNVENHAKVTHTVLGPDSGVGAGECHSSLVGPFVGFHHQSLLIAAVWPEGRGNIGYGANVGSNHTSRQADQEIWPGEGLFFGLSVVVKFPANFHESPYSVIGSGVACLPQRVAFPFSLINSQEEGGLAGVSLALNHLRPGWVLSQSMFMVMRSEDKYRSRGKARRTRTDWEVFRPSIIRLMLDARARLVAAAAARRGRAPSPEAEATALAALYIGDRDVPGLGKNYMTEASRVDGVASYTLHVRRYALRGLLARLECGLPSGLHAVDESITEGSQPGYNDPPPPPPGPRVCNGPGRLPPPFADAECVADLFRLRGGGGGGGDALLEEAEGGEAEEWELQQGILLEEYGAAERGLEKLVAELVKIEGEVARAVESSKARDDKRGAAVVPGYADAHVPARLESAVVRAHTLCQDVERRAHEVLSRL